MSKQTVGKYISRLKENGYIEILSHGRTHITTKGNELIKKLR